MSDGKLYSVEAEQAVLCALLQWPEVLDRVAARLQPDDFGKEDHGRLYLAMAAMRGEGVPIEAVTLRVFLDRKGWLEQVGGAAYLGYLLDVVPSAANVEHHVTIIQQHATRRRMLASAQRLAELAQGSLRGAELRTAADEVLQAMHRNDDAHGLRVLRVLDGTAEAPPAMLVERAILDADVNLVAGRGGSAKSLILHALAVAVAADVPAFGSLAVHRPGPVVLAVPEDGARFSRMALDALLVGLELEDRRGELTDRLLVVSDDVALNLQRDVGQLAATVRQARAVLLVLDPLRNMLPGADENEATTAGTILDALRREVCRATGAAVVLAHHFRKPAKDADPDAEASAQDVRGSDAWVAGSRLVFAVTKRTTENVVRLTAVKANRVAAADLRHELHLTIDAEPDNPAAWRSVLLEDRNAGAVTGSEAYTPGLARPLNDNERRALSALDDTDEPGLRLSYSAWVKRSGLRDSTLASVKDRLRKANLVTPIAAGQAKNGGQRYEYQLTDSGRGLLLRPFIARSSTKLEHSSRLDSSKLEAPIGKTYGAERADLELSGVELSGEAA